MMQRIKHQIRQAYGYTDEQILSHIQEYSEEWAYDSYQFIMEDKVTHWQTLMAVMPLARTPSDKKFSKSLIKYTKDLRKSIELTFAPWMEQKRIEAIKKRLAKPPEGVMVDETGKKIDLSDPEWWKKL